MKKTTRRLRLDATTLVHLTGPHLGAVQGGLPPETASACAEQCVSAGCTEPHYSDRCSAALNCTSRLGC